MQSDIILRAGASERRRPPLRIAAPQPDEAMGESLGAAMTLLRQAQDIIVRLESGAALDSLTGLLNRAAFLQAFAREVDRTRRGLSQGGLLVTIDIDNFAAVQNQHGKAAADTALKLVGRTLMSGIRLMDAAGRTGDDEFSLLLADARRSFALERVQQLAWKLNKLSLRWGDAEISLKASLGLKEYKGGEETGDFFAAT